MSLTSLARVIAACAAICVPASAAGTAAFAAPFNANSERDYACVEQHVCGGTAAVGSPSRDCACGGARVPEHSRLLTTGTDVAARDQQNPLPPAERPVAQGQPTWPRHPATLTRPHAAPPASADGFHWDDAGIGAGGAIAIVLAGLGGALLLRRRHVPRTHPAT